METTLAKAAKEPPSNSTPAKCGLLACCPCLKGVIVKALVKARTQPPRLGNPKNPSDYGIESYKEVSIQAVDGVRLSAWEILTPGSDKLAIINHPLSCFLFDSCFCLVFLTTLLHSLC